MKAKDIEHYEQLLKQFEEGKPIEEEVKKIHRGYKCMWTKMLIDEKDFRWLLQKTKESIGKEKK